MKKNAAGGCSPFEPAELSGPSDLAALGPYDPPSDGGHFFEFRPPVGAQIRVGSPPHGEELKEGLPHEVYPVPLTRKRPVVGKGLGDMT